ncbi:hypothetical protein SK128_005427 [Halocaridina rubra]|uniref:Uncharacterized protein n=1 Tax=Halocaridina rubra TaxID=373956 RepID=A0AAN9ADU3_HALRR
MVAGGVLSGIVLIIVEITYNRCKTKMTEQDQKITHQKSSRSDKIDSRGSAALEARDTEITSIQQVSKNCLISTNLSNTAEPSLSKNSLISTNLSNTVEPSLSKNSLISTNFSNTVEPSSSMRECCKTTCARNKCSATNEVYDTDASDANYVNSRLMLKEIEDRLESSPHLPEEWKARTPLQWLEYYSEILCHNSQAALQLADAQGTLTAMEELKEFVREAGIEDFAVLYNTSAHKDDPSLRKNNGREKDNNHPEGYQSQSRFSQDKETVTCHADVSTSEPNSYVTGDTQLKICKQQLEKLPDVLDNCSERGACTNEEDEEDECEYGTYAEEDGDFSR